MNIQFPSVLRSRKIFSQIIPFLENDKIILLTGARQAGKTYLMYLLINELRRRGIPSDNIYFYDLENVLTLQQLNQIRDFEDFIKTLPNFPLSAGNKLYLFIDEVQYLDYPASFLKYLVDHYKNRLKFIVSGSSSLEVRKKLTHKLTGRVYRFNILPLDYEEYLDFSQKKAAQDTFEEFCLYGGYPAVSLLPDRINKEKELAEIYSLYVKRDIQDYGGIEDIAGFNNLVKAMASQIGNLVNELELANTLGLSRQTIRKYLFLLNQTYVVHFLTPYFTNVRKEIRKMPKVYFIDSGLRNASLENFHDLSRRSDSGSIVENIIFLVIFTKISREEKGELNFWRTQNKQEVDFILNINNEIVPIEVKYQNFQKPVLPRNLRSFILQYHPQRAYVITKNFEAKEKFTDGEIFFVPAHKFYQVVSA